MPGIFARPLALITIESGLSPPCTKPAGVRIGNGVGDLNRDLDGTPDVHRRPAASARSDCPFWNSNAR